MKILHVINTLSAGGAELHLLTLCRHLRRLGVEVVVAYLKDRARGSRSLRPDFEREGIRTVDLGAERRFDPRCLLRFAGLVRRERPLLVHSHLPRADFVGAVTRVLFPSLPWVCSVHGIYSTHWSGARTVPLFMRVWHRSDALIAISHAVKEWLVAEGGIERTKVSVVHYGIDHERFQAPRYDWWKRAGLGGSAVVGSLGRFDPVKGHDVLIRAMPKVLRVRPDPRLVIAGSDVWGYRPTLQRLIDDLGLNGAVKLEEFQTDVASFLHALDVFAFASTSEGFGQVVIEAMAAGRPVVASRTAPLTEIVVEGETGLLVDPGEPEAFGRAILWLLSHPEEARQMGCRGQARVREHFSAERMAAETFAIYQAVARAAA